MMTEPSLWPLIRKVYSILSCQLLVHLAVCSIVVLVSVHTVTDLASINPGLEIYIVSLVRRFFISNPVYFCREQQVFSFLLISSFTFSIGSLVGFTCTFTSVSVILESASGTVVLGVSLTLYAFWAARRGHDSKFLEHFLFCSLMALIWLGILGIFFPFGKITAMIFSILRTAILDGYIVYDTSNLIKKHSSEDYSWASASVLYLDMISLFLHMLELFGSDRQ